MFAGTHRNNSTAASGYSGTYRVSDVAHHPHNFFHVTHRLLDSQFTHIVALQLHGFCCPGDLNYPTVTHDCIISNGVDAAPALSSFPELLRAAINAQNFVADDGNSGDLTTAAVFGNDADEPGATLNR